MTPDWLESFLARLEPRQDKHGRFSGRWLTFPGPPFPHLRAHLHGEVVLGPRYGGAGVERVTFMAIDVDGPSHGIEQSRTDAAVQALEDAATDHGLAATYVFSSRSGGGRHMYWLFTERVDKLIANGVAGWLARLAPGVADVIYPAIHGDGRVLAAPGCGLLAPDGSSEHVSPGGGVLLSDGGGSSPESLSGAFIAMGLAEPLKRAAREAHTPRRATGDRYASGALARAASAVAGAADGTRNSTLAAEAWNMGRFVAALGESQIHEALLSAALSAGLPREEAEDVIRRQVLAGVNNEWTR